MAVTEFDNDRILYNFILCANVLSCVPDYSERARMLRRLRDKLAPGGLALFVTQYRDASFSERIRSGRWIAYRGGWFAHGNGRASYFEMITRDQLAKLLIRYGFQVVGAHSYDKSAYVYGGDKASPHQQGRPSGRRVRSPVAGQKQSRLMAS